MSEKETVHCSPKMLQLLFLRYFWQILTYFNNSFTVAFEDDMHQIWNKIYHAPHVQYVAELTCEIYMFNCTTLLYVPNVAKYCSGVKIT